MAGNSRTKNSCSLRCHALDWTTIREAFAAGSPALAELDYPDPLAAEARKG